MVSKKVIGIHLSREILQSSNISHITLMIRMSSYPLKNEMPKRNDFSTRSMVNDFARESAISNTEDSRLLRNITRIRVNFFIFLLIFESSRQEKKAETKHQQESFGLNSDDDILERFTQRTCKVRQSSLNYEGREEDDMVKEIEKVDSLFHKNAGAYAHLLSIRGRLQDMQLVNEISENKKFKGKSVQPLQNQ
jgi:hypothetical protein